MADLQQLSTIRLSGCVVDLGRRAVVGPEPRTLTTREADLLRHLVERPSTTVSRDDLLASVWGYADAVVTRVCDNTVRRLRGKIEVDPSKPDHLITVHGTGYRFEPVRSAEVEVAPPVLAEPLIGIDGGRIDLPRARVEREDGAVDLSAQEVALLRRLLRGHGAVVERRILIREVWGTTRIASRALDHAVRRLRAKIEVDPSDPRHLLAGGGGFRLELPPVASRSSAHGLLGRDRLLADLGASCAAPGFTLILGPPGVGKTSLARVVADDATWVDVGPCATADELVAALGSALGIPLGDTPCDGLPVGTDRIGRVLAARGRCVVLDGLDRTALLVRDLLARLCALAPGLRLVGTSRIRLGVPGERSFEVGPLGDDDAVELFVRRATEASRSCRFDSAARDDIRALVRSLDRLPLAIELAAARAPMLSPRDLGARIAARPSQFLGPLRASIDAVVELLPPPEAEALLALCLFVGPFSVREAEGVLGDGALDALQGLRDHSLVHTRPTDGPLTLTLFDAVRERAREHLGARPDGGRAQTLAHVVALAELGRGDAMLSLSYAEAGAERDQLRSRVHELAHAARLALSVGATGEAACCARAAVYTWRVAGASSLALALTEEVLAVEAPATLERGHLALSAAISALYADRPEAARSALATARDIADRVDDATLSSQVWGALAAAAAFDDDTPARTRAYRVAAAWADRTPYRAYAAFLAARAEETDAPDRAEELLRTSLAHCGADIEQRAMTLGALYRVAWRAGRLGEAWDRSYQAMECQRALGQRMYLPQRYSELVLIAQEQGEHATASEMAEAGIAVAREMGMDSDEAMILAYQGYGDLICGRTTEAVTRLGRARALLEHLPVPRALLYAEFRLAAVHLVRGDVASAADLAARALDRSNRIEDPWCAGCCGSLLAVAEAELGVPGALARAKHAQSELLRVANPLDQTVGWCQLSRVARIVGEPGRAVEALAEAERLAAEHRLDRPGTEGAWALATARA